MPGLNRKEKLHVKSGGHNLQRGTLYDTRQDVQLDPLHASLVPTSNEDPELKWSITLQGDTQTQLVG